MVRLNPVTTRTVNAAIPNASSREVQHRFRCIHGPYNAFVIESLKRNVRGNTGAACNINELRSSSDTRVFDQIAASDLVRRELLRERVVLHSSA